MFTLLLVSFKTTQVIWRGAISLYILRMELYSDPRCSPSPCQVSPTTTRSVAASSRSPPPPHSSHPHISAPRLSWPPYFCVLKSTPPTLCIELTQQPFPFFLHVPLSRKNHPTSQWEGRVLKTPLFLQVTKYRRAFFQTFSRMYTSAGLK